MVVAYANTNSTLASSSASPNCTLPSGSAAGDCIVLLIGAVPPQSVGSFSNITGWTEIATIANITGWFQRSYYKILTSGDISAGSVTVNLGNANYAELILHRFTGTDPTTPVPSGGDTSNTGTSNTPTALSATVATSGSVAVRLEVNATGTGRTAGPAGWSATTGSPLDVNNWADYNSVSPSSTGAITSTLSGSDNWAVHMVVLQPTSTPSGPTIDTQPQSQSIYSGSTAIFTVSATSSGGTLHYQWKQNGTNVGTDSNSYTTGVNTLSNNGDIYTVDVTDDNGTITSNNAVLTVLPIFQVGWFKC